MDGYALYQELKRLGVELRVSDGQLQMRRSTVPAELEEDIRRNAAYLRYCVMEGAPEEHAMENFKIRWSRQRGYVEIRDPFTGAWHEAPVAACPAWMRDYLPRSRRRR